MPPSRIYAERIAHHAFQRASTTGLGDFPGWHINRVGSDLVIADTELSEVARVSVGDIDRWIVLAPHTRSWSRLAGQYIADVVLADNLAQTVRDTEQRLLDDFTGLIREVEADHGQETEAIPVPVLGPMPLYPTLWEHLDAE